MNQNNTKKKTTKAGETTVKKAYPKYIHLWSA